MTNQDQFSGLITEPDGSYSAAYGPFALKSAFQPIYSQSQRGLLKLEAYEALIRPFKGDEPVSPGQFFAMVEPGDGTTVDQLCRRLHILNAGVSKFDSALLFLNFDPEYFTDHSKLLLEAESLVAQARTAGLSTSQIVCEIIEKQACSGHILRSLCEALRECKVKIAIDDYGADDSDFERIEALKPDIVKFDTQWVHRFMDTNEGMALLRVMVQQFRERGILTLFEGLEEHWQVSLCNDLGVRLLQGFALGTPKLAPITAQTAQALRDGEASAPTDDTQPAAHVSSPAGSDRKSFAESRRTPAARPRRVAFGRRGT